MSYNLGSFRAWVIPGYAAGDAYYYPWDISKFIHEPRLIPERVSQRAGGMGQASFRYLRASREENGQLLYDGGYANIGCYVAVTAGVSAFSAAAVIFWGYINRRDLIEVAGGVDKTGSVSAQGLGYLLDGTQIDGFRQGAPAGVSVAMSSPPTFNINGAGGSDGGAVIGNKVTDAAGIPVFATLPSDCAAANIFSRLNVLQHVLKYCVPDAMPVMNATGSSAVSTYLNDTTSKEIIDVAGLTLKGAIDLLISRVHGFGWDLRPNVSNGWDIFVYPLVDDAAAYGTGYPAATPINIDVTTSNAESVGYTEDAGDLWDSVTVRGAPILIGATVSFADGNLAKGWTATQETAYRAGATGDAGYAALTPAQKIARNEQVRTASGIADAFQLYTLKLTNIALTRSATPGTGAGTVPLVPNITWDGTTAAVDDTLSKTPYLPTALLSRSLPWYEGVKGDATDNRDAAAKARPSYLLPRAFKYDTGAATGENVCQDLTVPGNNRGSPTITPDDNFPGMRVRYSPPETMAFNSWVDATDGIGRINTAAAGVVQADSLGRPFDYNKLALTVGVESDQRVSVTKRRYGVPAGSARRDLAITDERLQCQVMLAGSIVGSKSDGSADRVLTHTFVRNDFATAERLATMYAAFAFRKRTSINVTLARPDVLPAWAAIGTMVGTVTELSAYGPYPALIANAYTVVEAIDYSLTYERPRVSIYTTMPSMPGGMSGGSSSPAGGGSVSQSLGGTVAQAVAANKQEIAAVAQKATRVPTSVGEPGVVASGDGASIRETITVANSFMAGNVVYNNAGTWTLARADSAAGSAKYSGVIESATTTSFVVVYAGKITLAKTAGTTYYLSDITTGLADLRANLTLYALNIPVLRAISATACVVMASRDVACDLTTLSAGDIANGGGELVLNLATGGVRLIADDTDGIKLTLPSSVTVQVSMTGRIQATYASGNSVDINSADFVGTSKAVKLREIDICDSSGVAKKILVLSSAAY